MELREALTQITEIRSQLARTEVFRGYRAMPMAFSAAIAVVAGILQATAIPDPMSAVGSYAALWAAAAAVSLVAAGVEMAVRSRGSDPTISRELTRLALGQFFPSLAAGALLTVVMVRSAPEGSWMLPGLWQIVYSLGIFASCRLLPRPTFWVAGFYLVSGLTVLSVGRGAWAISPWTMAIPFCTGQFLAAAVLYATLERDHAAD